MTALIVAAAWVAAAVPAAIIVGQATRLRDRQRPGRHRGTTPSTHTHTRAPLPPPIPRPTARQRRDANR